MSMPRLLFVIHDDSFFCSHRLHLGQAALDAGFEVYVATRVQHHAKVIEEAGLEVLPIRLHGGFQSPLHELTSLIELIRLYRRVRPDIIHHVALKAILFGGVAARIARAPAVVNAITGLGYMFESGGYRRRLLRAAIAPGLRWGFAHPGSIAIFQNSDDCEDFVRARVLKRSQAEIVRGAGVNVSEFCSSPEPPGVPVVVLPSRMLWSKGVGEFVQAARLLKANGIQVRCVLVGTVDKKNPSSITETQLRCWEEEGVVEWWGHCDDMARVFAASHAVVLPSYGEGLPKSLLEGAACAKPLIATRVRGCQEIVKHGENGLLVPPRDAQALADAIMTLLHNKAMRERMGARGREIVVNEFTTERIAEETISLYRRLLVDGQASSLTRVNPSQVMPASHEQTSKGVVESAKGVSREARA
jgi:glycosyltransferase involved in cell wall biosynthesis